MKNFEYVSEGSSKILVLKKKSSNKGPGVKDNKPFYNPAMELNRDISILVGQWFVNASNKHVKILDGLAASSIRGIRFANEIDGSFDVTVNDWNENAYELINKNIDNINLDNIVSSNRNLNSLLSENKFDFIDIDPYGSPVYFIDSAIRSISHNGIISCTATDTATLCGVYPKVCLRRYGARPFHSVAMKEVGLRILIGYICREAAKYDKGVAPLLCHSTDHYFRVYLRIRNGVSHANESIKQVSLIDPDKISYKIVKKKFEVGPLWTGKIYNKSIIKEIRTILSTKKMNSKNMLWKLLDTFEDESDAPSFFYTSDDVSSVLKISPPKQKYIFEMLREKGFSVTRTHFDPLGFKTNAPRDIIESVFTRRE